VLALLALAVFPVFAHAGGIPEYELSEEETAVPHETVKAKQKSEAHSSETHKKAEGSVVHTKPNSESETESSSESESKQSAGGGTGNGGGNKPGGGGSKSEGSSQSGNKIGGSQEVATSSGVPASSEASSGGGSSPVVPILIAVVVLAAISIGVVLYRQRKDGAGPDDSRISSPNAG
jgi:cobalamin biosynthesis Mg chelatase CobN